MKLETLADSLVKGDRRALAKAISAVENREKGARVLLEKVGRRAGRTFVLGITGPPGTGKSTVVDRLVANYRKTGLKIGVIAVDPTSPISGGALLGDRIRMLDFATDEKVFIRSMASRGWSGGLSVAVSDTIRMIEAWGADLIFVETVGIGQADVEVMRIAHSVVVVLMPSMGDDVQASKAGLMEVGDVYVVNKSDLEGAEQTALMLLTMLKNSKEKRQVVRVSALKGLGIDELMGRIDELRSRFSGTEGREMRLRSIRGMMLELAKQRLLSRFEDGLNERMADELAEQVADHKVSFEEAVERIVEED